MLAAYIAPAVATAPLARTCARPRPHILVPPRALPNIPRARRAARLAANVVHTIHTQMSVLPTHVLAHSKEKASRCLFRRSLSPRHTTDTYNPSNRPYTCRNNAIFQLIDALQTVPCHWITAFIALVARIRRPVLLASAACPAAVYPRAASLSRSARLAPLKSTALQGPPCIARRSFPCYAPVA